MNKKGDTTTLLVLITGVIILIVIVPITLDIIDIGKKSTDIEACKTSLKFAAFKVGPIEGLKVQALASEERVGESCPHYDIKVSDSTKKPIILNEIENQISTCWNKFGRGKINFLSSFEAGKYEHFCFECASLIGQSLTQGSISAEEIKDLIEKKHKGKFDLNLVVRKAENYNFQYPIKIYFIASKNRDKQDIIFNDNEYLFYPLDQQNNPYFQNLGINYFIYIAMEDNNKERNKYCFSYPEKETKFVNTDEKEIRI